MTEKTTNYYVPESSKWPIVASVILFFLVIGLANFIQQASNPELSVSTGNSGTWGMYLFLASLACVFWMMHGWWKDTISEGIAGLNSEQMDRSYHMGMGWFIFSEVMFFAAFFGAMFYARLYAVPLLGGEFKGGITQELLWPNFQAMWPLTTTPGGEHLNVMNPWGLPLLNTIILQISSFTLLAAYKGLLAGNRKKLIALHGFTIIMGLLFLAVQAYEYYEAYAHVGLTLHSGIYGSTFFMLTGFHGVHVLVGTIFLIVLFFRCVKGHFDPDNHFGYQAGMWYWQFVDIVWLFLFVAVYWL